MIVNKKQLAEIVGRSEEWLTQMQKLPDFPVLHKRQGRAGSEYETKDVIEWMNKRNISNYVGNTALVDIEEAKRRKLAAEASLQELELMKEQSKVVEIEQVGKVMGEQLSNFRAKMLSLPSKCASSVFTAKDIKEAKLILEDTILEALNELVEYGNSEANAGIEEGFRSKDSGYSEAATTIDDQPMG